MAADPNDDVIYMQPTTRRPQALGPRRAAPPLAPYQRPKITRRTHWFEQENAEDRLHFERIIRFEQKAVEARVAEQLGHLAEVVGYQELVQGAHQIAVQLAQTLPATTAGQLAEDAASRALARMVLRHEAILDLLDAELQATFVS